MKGSKKLKKREAVDTVATAQATAAEDTLSSGSLKQAAASKEKKTKKNGSKRSEAVDATKKTKKRKRESSTAVQSDSAPMEPQGDATAATDVATADPNKKKKKKKHLLSEAQAKDQSAPEVQVSTVDAVEPDIEPPKKKKKKKRKETLENKENGCHHVQVSPTTAQEIAAFHTPNTAASAPAVLEGGVPADSAAKEHKKKKKKKSKGDAASACAEDATTVEAPEAATPMPADKVPVTPVLDVSAEEPLPEDTYEGTEDQEWPDATVHRSFRRVKSEEWLGKKGSMKNSYEATFGNSGWGAKAQQVLGATRGKGFRHEKTKKKRGSYMGGKIDTSTRASFKYDSD